MSAAGRSPLGRALAELEEADTAVAYEAADVVLRAKVLGAVDLAGESWARLVAAVERRRAAFGALADAPPAAAVRS